MRQGHEAAILPLPKTPDMLIDLALSVALSVQTVLKSLYRRVSGIRDRTLERNCSSPVAIEISIRNAQRGAGILRSDTERKVNTSSHTYNVKSCSQLHR